MDVAIMGVDLAKNVFQLHGVSRRGKVALKRRVSRERLMEHIGQLPPCLIGIEACAGAFYWQRRFSEHGHTVKIISPQYVKPFVHCRQKNDGNDAEAICTAVQQPRTRVVPPKSLEQRMSRRYIARGSVSSITAPRSSARCGASSSIAASCSASTSPERGP